MALIVVYDEGASPQTVEQVISSANTGEYVGRTDILINPDLTAVDGVLDRKYWKVVSTDVVAMTAGEQAAVDAAEAAAADSVLRTSATGQFDGQTTEGQALRALVKVLLDEVNILRAQHSLADRTLAQAKTAIQNAINNGDVDE